MRFTLIALLLTIITSSWSFAITEPVSLPNITKPTVHHVKNQVYICKSTSAYAYHQKQQCSGLRACKHDIITVSEQKAVDMFSRKPCKICYK